MLPRGQSSVVFVYITLVVIVVTLKEILRPRTFRMSTEPYLREGTHRINFRDLSMCVHQHRHASVGACVVFAAMSTHRCLQAGILPVW